MENKNMQRAAQYTNAVVRRYKVAKSVLAKGVS